MSRQTKNLPYRKKTNTSYIPFLSTKSNKIRIKERSARESNQNEIQIQPFHIFCEIDFMCTPTGLQILTWSTYVLHPITIIAVNNNDHPRMTMPYSTAYPSRKKVSDSNAKKSKFNAASTKQSKSVFMAKFCNSAQISARVLGISGVLQHRKKFLAMLRWICW